MTVLPEDSLTHKFARTRFHIQRHIRYIPIALQPRSPLLGLFTALTQFLGTEIFYIGDATVAAILSPIKNLATALVIIWRITRYGWSHASQAAYSS